MIFLLFLYLNALPLILCKRAPREEPPLVVLITGCSTGIGKSIALEFANQPQKYKVWATMRSTAAWDLPERPNFNILAMDVTSDESVTTAVDRIISEEGRIDVLINNAGYGLVGTVESVDISDGKGLFEVNLWGVVRVLQAVLPHMRATRKGHVINLSSTSGIRGLPANDFYTASKFALEGLCDSLRYSLAAFNIAVTNVNPGPVRTAFGDRYGNPSSGGRGKRLVNDTTGYLLSLEERSIASFSSRVVTDGQSSEEVARVVVNLVIIGKDAKKSSDVPFNIGTNRKTQALLDEVKRYPTGWGGLYSEIMLNMPPLPPPAEETAAGHSDEL